jgi:hypothetical protein
MDEYFFPCNLWIQVTIWMRKKNEKKSLDGYNILIGWNIQNMDEKTLR